MLHIQNYLRRGKNTPERLTAELNLNIRYHREFPELVLFKYDQKDTPMHNPISQEARGIILQKGTWDVVCYTFKKFFNYEDPLAVKIDWASAKALTKVDGSLIQKYFYKGEWRISTSGTPDALGEVNPTILPGMTYRDLFLETWQKFKYPELEETGKCFAFELTSPYNRVVCEYPESGITLLGVRDLVTLQEEDPEPYSKKYGIPLYNSQEVSTLGEVCNFANSLNPVSQGGEGFVVRDKFFNRIKVKNIQYLLLHHIKEGVTPEKILNLIVLGKYTEWIKSYPEYEDLYNRLRDLLDRFCTKTLSVYKEIEGIEAQKDFALVAMKYPFYWALFYFRRKKYSDIPEMFEKVKISCLYESLLKFEQQFPKSGQ